MKTMFEYVENAKPMRLTVTRDVGALTGMIFTAVADECGIGEDAVAQRLFDFVTGYAVSGDAGKPAAMGDSFGDVLEGIFPEIAGDDGLIANARRLNSAIDEEMATKFTGSAFDFRNFIGAES